MVTDVLNDVINNTTDVILAVGALGTAAYGLVDTSKAVKGGASNPGFGFIKDAVEPFLPPADGTRAFGHAQILATLRGNWVNGRSKAEQKAAATALIRLTMTMDNCTRLASAAGLDETAFGALCGRLTSGAELAPNDINLLGQFDAILSAALDSGYEQADQYYRNSTKAIAAMVALILATAGGAMLSEKPVFWSYFGSIDLAMAVMMGLLAVPVAPVAKDLSSTLASAVGAVAKLKRR